jgi:pyridoxine 5-phosphate synthase
MARLAVNVDHIATLRQARGIDIPDPVAAAAIVEWAGADGVVVHLREDRRHIQDRDVFILRKTVKTKLILEMAATDEMLAIALEIKPELVTLVPEKRHELTTEGGLNLQADSAITSSAVLSLRKQGIPVSVFIDPDGEQIDIAKEIGADYVEIHTGAFCDAKGAKAKHETFQKIVDSVRHAHRLKLGINAGHGLGYDTIKAFKGLPEIDEFSIGHSIVARAVMVGLDRAVRDMVTLVKEL